MELRKIKVQGPWTHATSLSYIVGSFFLWRLDLWTSTNCFTQLRFSIGPAKALQRPSGRPCGSTAPPLAWRQRPPPPPLVGDPRKQRRSWGGASAGSCGSFGRGLEVGLWFLVEMLGSNHQGPCLVGSKWFHVQVGFPSGLSEIGFGHRRTCFEGCHVVSGPTSGK